MFARALACGLCWSWLWVACAGAAHMPTTTTADTASNDNRHGLPLTLTPPIASGPWTRGHRRASTGGLPGAQWSACRGRRQQREPLGGPHTPDTGDGDTEDTSHSRQPSPRVTRRRLMRAPATVDLAEPPVETRSGERTCRAGDKFCP